MKKNHITKSLKTVRLVVACGLALWCPTLLNADVVILEKGGVLTGKVLKQDDDGVLIQMESGTHRYPRSWIKEVKKEPAAAPHVSNNGQRIPDWAQIVTLLANTQWSDGLKQIPATMIETGIWKNVPYISFQCQFGGYELNIFGDLGKPAAVQIGAMSFLKDSDEARSNCVSLICSVLANADDRKMVRALSWQQKVVQRNKGMTFETVTPSEWGAYGGWWVSVYSEDALAAARASDEELLTFTQPDVSAPQPSVANAQPAAVTAGAVDQSGAAPPPPAATTTQPPPTTTTAYATYSTWSDEELATARRATPGPPGTPATRGPVPAVASPAKVYPRTYSREGGTYRQPATRRR
jgi:hypothetical protein